MNNNTHGRICPILSISGYLNCKMSLCSFWLDDDEECAITQNAIDTYAALDRIASALESVANGVIYSPQNDIPSLSESAVIAAGALKVIEENTRCPELCNCRPTKESECAPSEN